MTTFPLPVALLKAAHLFSSTEQTRYYLCGVHLLRRGDHLRIAATDGHRLFAAAHTLEESGPDFDVILPRDSLKKAFTGLPRLMRDIAVTIDGANAQVGDVAMRCVDGSFPEIDRVIPNAGELTGEVAHFNPTYLADVGKAAKLLGDSVSGFTLSHNGDAPALVTFAHTRDALAVVMPMRRGADQRSPLHAGEVAEILHPRPAAADENAA